ncbi:MAG TPA: ACT domain-containing protein, partial [Verrucomicrobiae bacterium]|nr:ACT domain-containing protein [Verrucomicrobiae bacterium]
MPPSKTPMVRGRESLASRPGNRYQTSMQIPLVMTLIGPDRTGLVESVARIVAGHNGNWLESRMSRLGGEFAGILRIMIPEEEKTPLLAALQKIHGLNVVVRVQPELLPTTPGRQRKLEIVGQDRPGIIREITSALARAGVNVEELSSEVISAP